MTRAGQPSRRGFLKAAACAAPMIVPGRALGLDGAVAPSNRVAVGFIGTGSRMGGLMRSFLVEKDVQAVAVADPRDRARELARRVAGVGPDRSYRDFRELVARADIDAVAIASPDHWHVLHSIAAVQAGKDVYCEKPLGNTIAEGRALVEAVRRRGAVFQHGTQLHSLAPVRQACELVRNGRIGDLKRIVIGSPPGAAHPAMGPEKVPADIDYDLWLGPVPQRPYNSVIVNERGWYFVSDFSQSGWIAGYGVHDIDIAQWAIGMERSGPVEIEGRGVFPKDGLFDTVMTYEIEFGYASGVKLLMTDTSRNRHGVRFEGTRGWVFTRERIEAQPAELLEEVIRPGEIHLERSPGHTRNFLDCVKTRAEPITSAEIAHRATSTALLGGIAIRLARKLRWDPTRERFVGDEAANRMLSGAMRSPWAL